MMANEANAKREQKGYYVGEIPTQTQEVVSRPDGSPMTDKEWQADVLNKLDAILALIRNSL